MNILASLLGIIFYIAGAALFLFLLYLIIKAAVKKGILEAHEEIKRKE